MSDRDSFVRAIAQSPDDNTARLVYADWLNEHGDALDQHIALWLRTEVEFHTRLPEQGAAVSLAYLLLRMRIVETVVRQGGGTIEPLRRTRTEDKPPPPRKDTGQLRRSIPFEHS